MADNFILAGARQDGSNYGVVISATNAGTDVQGRPILALNLSGTIAGGATSAKQDELLAALAFTVTPHFKTLGASSSQVIPIGARGYMATILTGTGAIGGEAVPAGVSVSSSNKLAATVTITTDGASSAFVAWEV